MERFTNAKRFIKMKKIFRCKSCLNMSTRPRIKFDQNGVCNACNWVEEKKKINWKKREEILIRSIEKVKKNKKSDFDCIVPVSGGKDGSYVSHTLKNKYNLNILAVTCRPAMELDIGIQNLNNFVNSGFNHIHITPDLEIIRKVDKSGFLLDGQGYYGWMSTIFTGVLRIAQKFNIDLIFYGEDGEIEYGGSTEKKNDGFFGIEYMKRVYLNDNFEKIISHSNLKDKEKYWITFPDNLNKELQVTHLSFFENWDPYRNYLVAKQHCGLQDLDSTNTGTFTNFAQNDQILASLHYYLMFLKYGFGRATQDAGIEIRRGALGRDQGINLIKLYDGIFPEKNLEFFLNYFRMNENSFFEVIDSFANKEILEKSNKGWVLKQDVL